MTKILKGDDSPLIRIALADGFDYTGSTVEVIYQGAKRAFEGVSSGETISFRYSAAETSSMLLGVWPVTVRVKTADGRLVTMTNIKMRFAVTDCADEVVEGEPVGIDIRCGLFGIEGLPEKFTEEDLHAKLNEIIRRLGGKVEGE
jgi:hypothetical protein